MYKNLYNGVGLPEIPQEASVHNYLLIWESNKGYILEAFDRLLHMVMDNWPYEDTYCWQFANGAAYEVIDGEWVQYDTYTEPHPVVNDYTLPIWSKTDLPGTYDGSTLEIVFEGSEPGKMEYGWTDGWPADDLSLMTVKLSPGWSVAGSWQCIISGVDIEVATFEWYRNGVLILTHKGGTSSTCKPDAETIGTYEYYCVVTFDSGISASTDAMTAIVEYAEPGGDSGGGDTGGGDTGEGGGTGDGSDTDDDDTGDDNTGGGSGEGDTEGGDDVTGEQLQSEFMHGLSAGIAYALHTQPCFRSITVKKDGEEPSTGRGQLKRAFHTGFTSGAAMYASAPANPDNGSNAEPVVYLYNDLQAPTLPERDETVYLYAAICKKTPLFGIGDNGYFLYYLGADSHYYVSSSTGTVWFGGESANNETVPCIKYKYTNGVWEYVKSYDNGQLQVTKDNQHRNIWANFDIEYNGTLYLAASEPVPVYE